jgi:hypothetical protein
MGYLDTAFQIEMTEYLDEFLKDLKPRVSNVYYHNCNGALSSFVGFLETYEIHGFEDLTIGKVRSKLHRDLLAVSKNDKQNINRYTKRFFNFIYEKYGISNTKFLTRLNQ